MLLLVPAAYYLPQNTGAIARKYIKDPQLLSFIDAEVKQITSVLGVQSICMLCNMENNSLI